MQKVGYSLIDSSNNEIQKWGLFLGQDVSIPNVILLPNGDAVHAPTLGSLGEYTLVERWIDGDITKERLKDGEVISFDGTKTIITWTYRNPTKQELREHSAKKRRDLANGSAEINVGTRTIPVWVDSESRGSMTGLVVASNLVPDLTSEWKGSDGIFYTLTTSEIQLLALNTMSYVKSLFDKESEILIKIEDETYSEYSQIDTHYL